MYVCVSIYIKIEMYITHIKMKSMCTPTENIETNIASPYNFILLQQHQRTKARMAETERFSK